ncbi:hypothetical protein NQ314_003140, partial [Rhamnusium bicolor]
MSEIKEFESVEEILKKLPKDDFDKVYRIFFGQGIYMINVSAEAKNLSSQYNIELVSCGFNCKEEQIRSPRVIRVGLFQHHHPVHTSTSVGKTREHMFKLPKKPLKWLIKEVLMCSVSRKHGVNMPFTFCTREKTPWCEYAESAEHGPTTLYLAELGNAAIANGYFTCAINRVGMETFEHEFTSGNGQPAHKDFGHFYGSSYVSAPNGTRSPVRTGLSRTMNGLLIAEFDLNLCRQVKDHWGFQ